MTADKTLREVTQGTGCPDPAAHERASVSTDKTLRDKVALAIDRAIPVDDEFRVMNDGIIQACADAALRVVTEYWNERLEALAQELDDEAARMLEGLKLRSSLTQSAIATERVHAARRVRALKEGQQ